jgi:hypothetical protein
LALGSGTVVLKILSHFVSKPIENPSPRIRAMKNLDDKLGIDAGCQMDCAK